jgi:hypothetical protein
LYNNDGTEANAKSILQHSLSQGLMPEDMVRSASERRLPAPSLIHFAPGEHHEVHAISDYQLVLCLAPGQALLLCQTLGEVALDPTRRPPLDRP